ncbi:MAG: aminodeoxychorismate/anthranilate synthase component II [Alphaproteobacteria bacterium]|nr:aminodeoxychorismate/anthranilate synthase component II [Alphaproteobacteria bacterium]
MLLLIDNYDSFTYNLVHYFQDLGVEVVVRRNDDLGAAEAMALKPAQIVLSPGPCTPNEAGICLDLIKLAAADKTPLLGVCLGHQAIGQAFGGKVIRGPVPMHGKVSEIIHSNTSIFNGLPSPFKATRYHSLVVERNSFPADLDITAETADGQVMGLQHKTLPIYGVQFHPESILTEYGYQILVNFLKASHDPTIRLSPAIINERTNALRAIHQKAFEGR